MNLHMNFTQVGSDDVVRARRRTLENILLCWFYGGAWLFQGLADYTLECFLHANAHITYKGRGVYVARELLQLYHPW